MEKLLNYLNSNFNIKWADIYIFFHTLPGKAILSLIIIFVAFLISRLFFHSLKRVVKFYLFLKRRDNFYKLLYFRLDKLLKPIDYLYWFWIANLILNLFIKHQLISFLFFTLYTITIFWFVYEVIKFLLYSLISSKINKEASSRKELFNLFLNIAKIILTIAVIFIILSKLGVDLTALITSLGIGGAILGLAAKDTLTNFFDSIRLVSEDAFRQGDWIETRDVEGFVTEVGLTSTKIRTFDNAMVTIPNSKLVNDYIKNWTKRVIGRRIKFHIRIKYTTNLKEIDRVIYEIYDMLHKHPDIMTLNKLRYLKRWKNLYEDGIFNLEDRYGVRRTLLVYLDEL
ncbi:MAG: mechanosensitive ion channel, partial [Epsilonproteobacteria bacterium]|nr:mechanosensitive ion channel [Campylobacterota bacterium]